MNLERLNELFSIVNEGYSSIQEREIRDYITNLQKENEQLKDNWNKLREWIVYNKHNENTEQHYLVVDYGTLLGKMQELIQGSDNNE